MALLSLESRSPRSTEITDVLNNRRRCVRHFSNRRPSMMLSIFVMTLALSGSLVKVAGYGSGAPETACASLRPGHGQSVQQSVLPYNISVSTQTLSPGQRAHIIIQKLEDGPPFQGFMVQVRPLGSSESTAVGRFISRDHKLLSCSEQPNSTITHSESRDKVAVKLHWLAPQQLDASVLDIEFRVTVLRDFATYWVSLPSDPVRISPDGTQTLPPPTTSSPGISSVQTEVSVAVGTDVSTVNEDAITSVYDSCLVSKGCFALTDQCLSRRNCELLATHERLTNGYYRFQLVAKVPVTYYIAVALSDDASMGNDAVIYCVSDGSGRFSVHHSFNRGRSSETVGPEEAAAAAAAVSDVSGLYKDGYMLCKFTHAPQFVINGRRWDMSADNSQPSQHLLIASGVAGADSERRPQYHHSRRRSTTAPLQLGATSAATGGSSSSQHILIRVHGALMVAAWLGAASTGMLVARYYKHTWVGRQLNGLDLWFQCHRTLMVFTVLLTLAAIVCIFIELGGWTSTPLFGGEGSSLHPLLGAVCTLLACLQPLMAACRPHPGAARRPLFNWLHWLVGSAAHILAVSAVFFAIELPAAQLPFWTYWLLAVFVGFHAACHVMLSLQQCWSDRRLLAKTQPRAVAPGLVPPHHAAAGEMYGMRDIGSVGLNGYAAYQQTSVDRELDAPGSSFRRTLLGVYISINTIIVLVIVLMVVFAPAENWL